MIPQLQRYPQRDERADEEYNCATICIVIRQEFTHSPERIAICPGSEISDLTTDKLTTPGRQTMGKNHPEKTMVDAA
jgi:hypothetical protein